MPSQLEITAQLANSLEKLAAQWEAEGNHADAKHLRELGPTICAELAKAAHSPMGLTGVLDALHFAYSVKTQ